MPEFEFSHGTNKIYFKRSLFMKNIIIAGPSRAGKTTLAERLNEELNYFVISLDKIVATFGRAYPQMDIRLHMDYEKMKDNLAPFLGHFLGVFSDFRHVEDDQNFRARIIDVSLN